MCRQENEITSGQRSKTNTATTVVKFTFARKRNLQYCRRNDRCSEPLAGGVGRHFFSRDHENKFLTVTRESLKTPGRISEGVHFSVLFDRVPEVTFENNFVYEKRQDRIRSLYK